MFKIMFTSIQVSSDNFCHFDNYYCVLDFFRKHAYR